MFPLPVCSHCFRNHSWTGISCNNCSSPFLSFDLLLLLEFFLVQFVLVRISCNSQQNEQNSRLVAISRILFTCKCQQEISSVMLNSNTWYLPFGVSKMNSFALLYHWLWADTHNWNTNFNSIKQFTTKYTEFISVGQISLTQSNSQCDRRYWIGTADTKWNECAVVIRVKPHAIPIYFGVGVQFHGQLFTKYKRQSITTDLLKWENHLKWHSSHWIPKIQFEMVFINLWNLV